MRYFKCFIFWIVKRQNLVLCLLNQHAEPYRQIRTNHMHQSEARQHFVSIHFDLLRVAMNIMKRKKRDEVKKKNRKNFLPHHHVPIGSDFRLSRKLISINHDDDYEKGDFLQIEWTRTHLIV